MEFRPLYERILVKRAPEAEKIGNIVIPDDAKEKPQMGTVIATGDGRRDVNGDLIPLDVKVGDRILFGKFAGSDITIDGETFVVMKEEECFGVTGACEHFNVKKWTTTAGRKMEWCTRCGSLETAKGWEVPGRVHDGI